jgi:endo-1,4-beta-xylanase
MNRRDFIRRTGLGAVSLVAATSFLAAQETGGGESMAKDQILGEVDDRIEKHRKGDAVLRLTGQDGEPLRGSLTVNVEQTGHKFLFGCNIFKLGRCRTPDDNGAYEKHFAGLLNYATLPFYWWNYERVQGKPDDARTEEIVRWCKAHHVTTKGHPLAWNWAQPPWLTDDPTEAMKAQFKRIERCVRKFKGDIDIWDVVNEATHYDRPQAKERAAALTEAIRRMGIGAYVCQAFKAARRANPDAMLVINDYRTDPAYADKVISQLVDEQGKPLYDVIGIQSHMHGGYWGAQRAWEVCEYFAKFGKPLHFTETTLVSGPRAEGGWNTTADGEKRQADEVADFYRICFSHPAVEAITWWDFTDQGAWQGAPAGFLRKDMTPKPAYDELMRLVKGKWWTQTKAALAPEGEARFRGFYGQYKVATVVEGHRLAGSFSFDKTTSQPIDVGLG